MNVDRGKTAIFVGLLTVCALVLTPLHVALADLANPFYQSEGETPENPYSWLFKPLTPPNESTPTVAAPAGMEIQGDDFVVQQLLNGDINALGCVQQATSNMTAMMFFGANGNSEERRQSPNHFFNIQIMERFDGAAWPVYTDTLRAGTVENILFESDYQHQMPSQERCESIENLIENRDRELTQTEQDDWIHCAKACNEVWKVIEARERQMTNSEKRLLKYCDRSAFGLISERAALYRQIGGFMELTFSEQECDFPGNGTIDCSHRRDVNLGGLPVNGVEVLGKQEVSYTESNFLRKYWMNINFFIKEGNGTRRYSIYLEYNVNETLTEPDGDVIESMDECQPLG